MNVRTAASRLNWWWNSALRVSSSKQRRSGSRWAPGRDCRARDPGSPNRRLTVAAAVWDLALSCSTRPFAMLVGHVLIRCPAFNTALRRHCLHDEGRTSHNKRGRLPVNTEHSDTPPFLRGPRKLNGESYFPTIPRSNIWQAAQTMELIIMHFISLGSLGSFCCQCPITMNIIEHYSMPGRPRCFGISLSYYRQYLFFSSVYCSQKLRDMAESFPFHRSSVVLLKSSIFWDTTPCGPIKARTAWHLYPRR
jgi:hypothetical protein